MHCASSAHCGPTTHGVPTNLTYDPMPLCTLDCAQYHGAHGRPNTHWCTFLSCPWTQCICALYIQVHMVDPVHFYHRVGVQVRTQFSPEHSLCTWKALSRVTALAMHWEAGPSYGPVPLCTKYVGPPLTQYLVLPHPRVMHPIQFVKPAVHIVYQFRKAKFWKVACPLTKVCLGSVIGHLPQCGHHRLKEVRAVILQQLRNRQRPRQKICQGRKWVFSLLSSVSKMFNAHPTRNKSMTLESWIKMTLARMIMTMMTVATWCTWWCAKCNRMVGTLQHQDRGMR